MRAEAVVEVVATLREAGVGFWLDGGWGVDALIGEQTREHGDLDLIVDVADAGRLCPVLDTLGFKPKAGGTETSLVLETPDGCQIDVHLIEFDERGRGVFMLEDGRRWPFPSAAFSGVGHVLGEPVACLAPDAQVQCHAQGYEPTDKDLHDMELLQRRFGVVLPIVLCRGDQVGRRALPWRWSSTAISTGRWFGWSRLAPTT